MKNMSLATFLLTALALMPGSLAAQRNLRKAPKPDPAAELREFQPAEGFEVNLFAANPMIAKPINMNCSSDANSSASRPSPPMRLMVSVILLCNPSSVPLQLNGAVPVRRSDRIGV